MSAYTNIIKIKVFASVLDDTVFMWHCSVVDLHYC